MSPVNSMFWYAKALFYVSRYPAYTVDFIKQEIESQAAQIPEDELARYSEFSTSKRHFMAEIMLIYTIISVKNLYFVYYTMTNVDFINPEANIKPLGAGGEFKYACLVSDCSRYIRTESNATISLASELNKLPVFAMCKQDWKWLFNPALGAQKMALVMCSDLTFFFTSVSVLAPILISLISPIPNVAILFSICPLAELSRIRRKIGVTLEKLSFSLNNFIMNEAFERYDSRVKRLRQTPRNQIKTTSLVSSEFLFALNNNNYSNTDRMVTDCHLDSIKGNKKYIGDYLPINRTKWWRQIWAHSVTSVCPVALIYSCSNYIMLQFGASYYAQFIAIEEQSDVLDLVHRANCSLWYDTNHSANAVNEAKEILSLKHLESRWNWLTIIELFLVPIIPILVSCATISNYYFSCVDIKVCIIELRILSNIAIDCIQLSHIKPNICMNNYGFKKAAHPKHRQLSPAAYCTDSQIHGPRTGSTARIELKSSTSHEMSWLTSTIFDRLTKMINFDWLILSITPIDRFGRAVKCKLGARLVDQEFALQLIKSALDENKDSDPVADLLVKLLEIIHVNYRTLVELLDEHNPSFRTILLTSWLSNYGFTLVNVYLYRNIDDIRKGPLLYLSILWIIVTFLISISSSIHADFKKIDHVFWSIVASTTNCQDIRVQHFRRIWQKNLIAVDADGGLAVKIGKISVTYVRILQLTFGTATIFALALNKY